MDLTKADQYYLKAIDGYPFNMEFVIENLNYALSYDDEHASSNCLLGRIFMYDLKNYEKAGQCFYQALKGDFNFPDTYKHYSLLRIWQGEYSRALNIIERGAKVKGMDQSSLLIQKAIIYELTGDFLRAHKVLKKAKLFSIDKNKTNKIKEDLIRIKQKMKPNKTVLKNN